MKKKIISVVGARPNFLKLAPLHEEFSKYPQTFQSLVVHTGQHYDYVMSDVFFRDLDLPKPDFHLEVGSANHSIQTAKVMTSFESVIQQSRPDLVIVFGDVNSTLACALVCAKNRIPLAHVEAGLRSFDQKMPEEINRLLTDQVSDFLFVTEKAGMDNLLKEGIAEKKCFLVGNIMLDTINHSWDKILVSKILQQLNLRSKEYILMTMHRAGNVDSPKKLSQLIEIVRKITRLKPVLFPLHPRTSKNLKNLGLYDELKQIDRLRLVDPLGYLEFLCAAKDAIGGISDSGGLQSETPFLNVPCLTLREVTEQPITIELGTNTLAGFNADSILKWLKKVLDGETGKSMAIPLWDGKTSERIVGILRNSQW